MTPCWKELGWGILKIKEILTIFKVKNADVSLNLNDF